MGQPFYSPRKLYEMRYSTINGWTLGPQSIALKLGAFGELP